MKNIEKKLNSLPKARLSLSVDLKIRMRLYSLILRKFVDRLFSFELPVWKKFAAAVPIVLVLAIVVVPAYAYASPSVTRGNVLYPLKQLAEKAELSLSLSDESRVEVYEKKVSRRLAEAEYLSLNKKRGNSANLTTTVNEALADKQKAAEILFGLPKQVKTVSSQDDKMQEEQSLLLIKVAQNVGFVADEEVVNAVSLALNMISDKSVKPEIKKDLGENAPKESTSADTAGDRTNAEIKKNNTADRGGRQATTTDKSNMQEDSKKANANRQTKLPAEINQTKKSIDNLMETLKKDDLTNEETGSLRTRLDAKIEKASQALNKGDYNKAGELVDESRSLVKNAKFFIKPKQVETDDKKIDKNNSDKKVIDQKDPLVTKQSTSTESIKNKGKSTSTDSEKNKLPRYFHK